MADVLISRGLLSDQVYDLIRTSILDGTRAPGARIVESEVARSLSISQAPVREAVKRLVHDGLVTSIPRNGSYVTEVSPAELEIARQVRASVERIGARSAAVDATPEDLAGLRRIVERMREAVESGSWADFRVIDMQFHGAVMAIGGHLVLSRMWSTLEPVLLSQRGIGDPFYVGDKAKLIPWHDDLIAALESGDADLAGEAFFVHAAGILPATE
ncbi:GntR family transcriptional regulator [Herbiconiux sp. P16]|uniref:GntR family transcriptional regulator n=1 Tax=Herbiconiux wuyangfengii TaxID=3342794 RepID=UPI0035BA186E